MQEFINKWQNVIAGLLITAMLIYGAYNYIYKPKIKEINNLRTSLKMIDSEIRAIPGGDLLLKDLNSARSLLKKELEVLSQKIPPETQTPYLINNFTSVVGKGLNIDYNLIQPLDVVQEQKYKRLPLRLEFEGDYANLNTYLAQLKNLPVTIRVDSMDLHRLSGTRKLAIRMNLSAFMMPGGPEKPKVQTVKYPVGSDPFYVTSKKGGTRAESVAGLRYSGYWIGKEIQAIINDEVLRVGDKTNGFTVVKIYKDHVVLRKNNNNYELFMEKNK